VGLAAALMARARAPMFPSFALPLVWLLALVAFSVTLPSELRRTSARGACWAGAC
jgi:hypothetical protein